MIKLKRLLLIHWQAYDFQLVEFEDITLITGQTGVGKSTIIDALNVILLGEKQKHIFNKAANENSRRTLESYLYGKLGDDGGDGFFYLREENSEMMVGMDFSICVRKTLLVIW
ncbi:ATP-binding protein [Enterococcus sp. AZ080]|uniref:ATP-binding protein n=1 Tax=Enterococcus sp. AZ080 TaxID=2774793 RepID=UPI003F24BBAE